MCAFLGRVALIVHGRSDCKEGAVPHWSLERPVMRKAVRGREEHMTSLGHVTSWEESYRDSQCLQEDSHQQGEMWGPFSLSYQLDIVNTGTWWMVCKCF